MPGTLLRSLCAALIIALLLSVLACHAQCGGDAFNSQSVVGRFAHYGGPKGDCFTSQGVYPVYGDDYDRYDFPDSIIDDMRDPNAVWIYPASRNGCLDDCLNHYMDQFSYLTVVEPAVSQTVEVPEWVFDPLKRTLREVRMVKKVTDFDSKHSCRKRLKQLYFRASRLVPDPGLKYLFRLKGYLCAHDRKSAWRTVDSAYRELLTNRQVNLSSLFHKFGQEFSRLGTRLDWAICDDYMRLGFGENPNLRHAYADMVSSIAPEFKQKCRIYGARPYFSRGVYALPYRYIPQCEYKRDRARNMTNTWKRFEYLFSRVANKQLLVASCKFLLEGRKRWLEADMVQLYLELGPDKAREVRLHAERSISAFQTRHWHKGLEECRIAERLTCGHTDFHNVLADELYFQGLETAGDLARSSPAVYATINSEKLITRLAAGLESIRAKDWGSAWRSLEEVDKLTSSHEIRWLIANKYLFCRRLHVPSVEPAGSIPASAYTPSLKNYNPRRAEACTWIKRFTSVTPDWSSFCRLDSCRQQIESRYKAVEVAESSITR